MSICRLSNALVIYCLALAVQHSQPSSSLAADPKGTGKPAQAILKTSITRGKGQISITREKMATIIHIHDKGGIGGASVTRTQKEWPREVVLRVHLAGLESLQIDSGQELLQTSVSSGGHRQRMSLRAKRQQEIKVEADHPYWSDVSFHDENGESTEAPSKNGFYQIVIPPGLFAYNPKTIYLHWVDFYR